LLNRKGTQPFDQRSKDSYIARIALGLTQLPQIPLDAQQSLAEAAQLVVWSPYASLHPKRLEHRVHRIRIEAGLKLRKQLAWH
jgi:hypothetical protein